MNVLLNFSQIPFFHIGEAIKIPESIDNLSCWVYNNININVTEKQK